MRLVLVFCVVTMIHAMAVAEVVLSKPKVEFWPESVGNVSVLYPVYINNPSREQPIEVDIFNNCSSDFSVSEVYCGLEIAPLDGCELWLRFKPQAPGQHKCEIYIEDSMGDMTVLPLSGTGL